MGFLHAVRRRIYWFIETNFFNNIILLSVFLNTVMLASQGLVNDAKGQALLSDFNLAFTIIFTVEMALKIIGLGPMGIFSILIILLKLNF